MREVMPRRWGRPLAAAADLIGVLAIAFGVAGSVGMGVLQIRSGLSRAFGVVDDTPLLTVAILALLVTASVLPAFGRFRQMDRALGEPESLVLLRGVPLFAPLDAKSLESIAGKLVRIELPAGQSVIREGEEGDRFYVIESGALTATFQGDLLSQMGPGDPFGEIALLRDVPRTATVTADEDSVLLALERQDFLDAISDNSDASMRADDLISRRIPTY